MSRKEIEESVATPTKGKKSKDIPISIGCEESDTTPPTKKSKNEKKEVKIPIPRDILLPNKEKASRTINIMSWNVNGFNAMFKNKKDVEFLSIVGKHKPEWPWQAPGPTNE